MLKRKILIFVVLAVFSAVLLLLPMPSQGTAVGETSLDNDRRLTLLLLGLDEAAGNTDVLVLLSFDEERKELSALQIPRDTYFFSDTVQNKINQIYPAERSKGKGEQDAFLFLQKELAAAFGVPIDYFLALDLATLADIFDAIGGVTICLPAAVRHPLSDGTYREFPAGEQTLQGQGAIDFIRHRAGYQNGDLGRINAQKILLTAAYHKITAQMSPLALFRIVPQFYGRIRTNMPMSDQLSLARMLYDDAPKTLDFYTLPGEATRGEVTDGAWYYVVNRRAAERLLSSHFDGVAFDKNGKMLDKKRPHFKEIYENTVKEYS